MPTSISIREPDAAARHRQSLEHLLEVKSYYETCAPADRDSARLLLYVAELNEKEARQAWMRSLAGGAPLF